MAGMFGAVKSRPVDGTAIGRALFGTPKRSLAPITAADRFKGVPRGTYSGPSLKAAKPSLGERMKQRTSDALASIGVSRRTANRVADRVTGFLEDVTPAGDAMTADDARTAFRQGKPAKGLGLGALAALGVVPGFGDAISKAAKGIRAWHGSPHDFDRFDLSKIGTGEGAQAYGHGLYFAENPQVARDYQRKLRGGGDGTSPVDIAQRYIDDAGGDTAKALETLRAQIDGAMRRGGYPERLMKARNIINIEPQKATGRLYEVNINADPDSLLDWEAGMIRNQPAPVQERLRPLMERGVLKPKQNAPNIILGNERIIADAGVPGLRYLDQGSRGSGQGTRNYVIFDDSLVEILKKY